MLISMRALILGLSLALSAAPVSSAMAQRVAPSAVHRLSATPHGVASVADSATVQERTRVDVAKRGAVIGSVIGAVTGASLFAVFIAVDQGTLVADGGDKVFIFSVLTGGGALGGGLLGAAIGALAGG